ncbi:MAG: XcyI family restriction endonuclease [Solirubrobacterales bacterium]
MAQSSDDKGLSLPEPSRQVSFHESLVAARKLWLKDALSAALAAADPDEVQREIARHAPKDARQILAQAGIRDEEVFPTPTLLRAKPTLVGYYRLLLGMPQKSFYTKETGMSPFKAMEERDLLRQRADELLPEFCATMGEALAELIRQLSPTVTQRDVDELPLLIIGSQFQGSMNNRIGQQATVDVFLAIKETVKGWITQETEQQVTVENAAGRIVRITLAADPDVRIEEEFGEELRPKVALEIKGGTDRSNAHNRVGEAEKSHQKAKLDGFRDFWTVIAKKGLDLAVLRGESPTTNSWFDAAQVLAREGDDWDDFRSRIAGEVGIPL